MDVLGERVVTVKQTYFEKDKRKFSNCNVLITRGVSGSSSHRYQHIPPVDGLIINPTSFSKEDVVGVSANGGPVHRRMTPDYDLIQKALDAECVIVTDTKYH